MVEKLGIRRCDVNQQTKQAAPQSGAGALFEVTINPAEVKHSYAINYSDDDRRRARAIGDTSSEQTFASYAAETVSFSLVLDATGAVPTPDGSPPKAVRDLVSSLKKIVYDYNSDAHEPNVVKLSWGSAFENFFARLRDLSIDYTLFSPTGTPLRAKLQLSFVRYLSSAEAKRADSAQSPDMSRVIRVREGDTLPLLCERIYGDGRHYLHVARANDLVNFRALQANTLLRFPPLDAS